LGSSKQNGGCVIDDKLAEAVRVFPILYDKSLKDFKDRNKKSLAWADVAKSVGFASGKLQKFLFCSSDCASFDKFVYK
jgi:hypothetical protein